MTSLLPGRSGDKTVLPEKGLEPLLAKANGILNPARLPIPPLRLMYLFKLYYRSSGET